MEQSCWIEFSGYFLPKFNGSNILGVKLSRMKACPSWITILPVYFPWPTLRQSPPFTDGHVDWKRPWNWRDWQLYLTCRGQGRSKANIEIRSQRDVKYGISGSHAFPPKVDEPCTANLSRHETPTPTLFSLRHQCPTLTQLAVSSIMKSLYRPGFGMAKLPPPLWGMLIGHFGSSSMDGIYFMCDIGSLWGPR